MNKQIGLNVANTFIRQRIVLMGLLLAMSVNLASAAQTTDVNTLYNHQQDNHQQKPVTLDGPNWQHFAQLNDAGFLFVDENYQLLDAKNAQQFFVPASTTKLITALLSLQHWGEKHRFKTEFYLKQQVNALPILIVKGYGDPFLVSEELQILAKNLAAKLSKLNVTQLAGIQLDASYYLPGLVMPGTGETDNPYDAIPAAIAANFNSIYIHKKGQRLTSAEPQTPLTASGLKIAKTIKGYTKSNNKRVNLGNDAQLNERYFAELLGEFLHQNNITVGKQVSFANVDQDAAKPPKKIYTHLNSKDLAEIIKPMMKYSTNFIANQLALNIGAEMYGAPATQQKVQKAYQALLSKQFHWQKFHIEDGAGLSRNNQLAPSQLVDVLEAFTPWKNLLPQIETSVYAKSGTLIGVSTLAGYVQKQQKFLPFAIMINQKVPFRFRNKLAKELAQTAIEIH
ncbi:D-alanyl-D-alanine carboxypeptidase/D-alanyl-D-alanine-endopeptidase [Thiomicrorhabdus hydrogeniphila]